MKHVLDSLSLLFTAFSYWYGAAASRLFIEPCDGVTAELLHFSMHSSAP